MIQTPRPSFGTGWAFVLVTFTVIAGVYYQLIRYSYPQARDQFNSERGKTTLYLICVHILLFLQLWSLLNVMVSPPGSVPPFWVRYCLMCHVFKPERCHHCSVCNYCVLHMDHHCPWVNNCIGFYNRKLFLLLLWYTICLLGCLVIGTFPEVKRAGERLVVRGRKDGVHGREMRENLVTVGFYAFEVLLTGVLSTFFKFHVMLVLTNSSTIEGIERNPGSRNEYDIGWRGNWVQVFGSNPGLWLFPIYSTSGLPVGDGVTWPYRPEVKEPAFSDTPKVKNGSKKIVLTAQEDAFAQMRNSGRQPEVGNRGKSEMDTTVHPEESDMRDLNRAAGNNSSLLSQSFK